MVLYGGERGGEAGRVDAGEASGAPADLGITGVVPKHAAGSTIMDLIEAACPRDGGGPILVVDDDPDARAAHAALVRSGLPGRRIRTADDGQAALAAMEEETPALVLLDLCMPVMDGADVLDRMRADARLRRVPVVVLTNRVLGDEEVRRLERHARVTVQTKGIWSDQEIVSALHRGLFGSDSLPPQTGALVKRAAAWLARNHARTVSRWQLAEAVNASPDYVGRLFRRELGISPVEYVNRYRVHRACELLVKTGGSMKEIAAEVGIPDHAYFTRVFRKITGTTPQKYRQ
jgi:AraC-like DNA-binding protein